MDETRLFFEDLFASGRQLIERAMIRQLERTAPETLTVLQRAGGAALHEPLLYAWLSCEAPSIGMDQLIFGYLPEQDRPLAIDVRTNHEGVAHLPNLGSLRTDLPDAVLELRASPGAAPTLWSQGRPVRADFAPRVTVPGTSIELYTDLHPFFFRFFTPAPQEHEIEVEIPTHRCLGALNKAFELLARVSPEQRATIERDCRGIVILRSEKIRSFASLGIHGLVFLSVPAQPTEIFFCEDLIHQVGHVSFFAITAHHCFTIPASTPLSQFTVLQNDSRTLFGAFHGNYTIMKMVQFLDACLEQNATDGALRHEVLGRLALSMRRFESGLQSIDDERLYTPMAWELHCRMIHAFEELRSRRSSLLSSLDLSDQSYAFDYEVFCARNPLHADHERLVG